MTNFASWKTSKQVFFTILLFFLYLPQLASADESFIIDSSGKKVIIDKPFTRIISLYSAHSENLVSLGAIDTLIGISKSDDFPPEILQKPKFSYREDPEKFIRLKPDLVLIRPMIQRSYPQFIKKLEKAGIKVISLQPNSVSEMFDYWKNLGTLVGKKEQADTMIADFKSRLAVVQKSLQTIDKSKKKRPRVYFQSIHKKMKTFARESIGAFVLEQAGGINIASDAIQVRKTNIASYGKEKLLSKGAEIDIFLAQRGRMNPVDIDTIVHEPGFGAIKAVQEKKVFLIEEALVSRPTMRILDGIEKLHKLFFE